MPEYTRAPPPGLDGASTARWRSSMLPAMLKEAELRFARVRLNEHIDSVSLHGGEEGEKGTPEY